MALNLKITQKPTIYNFLIIGLKIDSCVYSRVKLITIYRRQSPHLLALVRSCFYFHENVLFHFFSFLGEILCGHVAETENLKPVDIGVEVAQ